MRHIDEFMIHRFRGVRDLKLEKLGQVTLLVGGNNSGKSSVLEALFLYCDPFNVRVWLDMASMRDLWQSYVGLWPTGLLNRLTWLFPQGKDGLANSFLSSDISLAAKGNIERKQLTIQYEKFSSLNQTQAGLVREENTASSPQYLKESEGLKLHIASQDASGRRADKTYEFFNDRFPDLGHYQTVAMPVRLITTFSHRLGGLSANQWTDVVESNNKDEIIQLLQLFDSDIEDVDIITSAESQEPVVSVKHRKLGRAPLNSFGDGLRHVFTVATAIPGVKNGLLLVDELDEAIHTKNLQKNFDWMVKACRLSNVQLFVTTHSLEAVDAIIDACSSAATDLVAYRLQKDGDHITAKRFGKDYLKRLREELGVDLRW